MDGIGRKIAYLMYGIKPGLSRAIFLLEIMFRWALGVIFIYSGIEKIAHPQDFLATVYDFRLTGPVLGILVAIVMPWLEALLGGALLIGAYPGGMLFAASVLGALFLMVQASAIMRGLTVSCGCFGPDGAHMVSRITLLRTMVIFCTAVVSWLLHYRRVLPRMARVPKRTDDFVPPIKLRGCP